MNQMKYLIGFCLCLTSAAYGDDIAEKSDRLRLKHGLSRTLEEGSGGNVADVDRILLQRLAESNPEDADDVEHARQLKESAQRRLKELEARNDADGSDPEEAIEEEWTEEEATNEEWKPRFAVTLQLDDSVITKERVPYQGYPDSNGIEPQVEYREREVRIFGQTPGFATLYCDSVTLNVSEDGDNSSFELKCETRISLHYKGGVFTSNAATFYDGKCELADATFTQNGMTAKADKLVLTLPVHGVTTNKFGTAIPETPQQPTRDPDTFTREFRSDEDESFDSRPRKPDDETVRSRSRDFDRPEPNTGPTQEDDSEQQQPALRPFRPSSHKRSRR